MPGLDFTFDCPVYLLSPESGGYLLAEDHSRCLWTDADAATIFLDHTGEGRPYLDGLFLVEIETDNDLLSLLTAALQDGIREVAFDVASADQRIARVLYVVDVIDMLRERIAET
jgi:hypothetical protein